MLTVTWVGEELRPCNKQLFLCHLSSSRGHLVSRKDDEKVLEDFIKQNSTIP